MSINSTSLSNDFYSLHHPDASIAEVLCKRIKKWRHLCYLTLGTNPVMLHVICLVIIMLMDSGTALADLYYFSSALSVIHSPTPGAN